MLLVCIYPDVISLSQHAHVKYLGPSSLISWFAIARTVAQAISFTIIGRLSDIFGRRQVVHILQRTTLILSPATFSLGEMRPLYWASSLRPWLQT